MDFPSDLKYTKDHEWISKVTNGIALVGISAYAVEHLGDIVNVELPDVGLTKTKGESVSTIESTKTVSDVYLPIDGKIVEINKELTKDPEILQNDPYKKGWLFKLEVKGSLDSAGLYDATAYKKYVLELDH